MSALGRKLAGLRKQAGAPGPESPAPAIRPSGTFPRPAEEGISIKNAGSGRCTEPPASRISTPSSLLAASLPPGAGTALPESLPGLLPPAGKGVPEGGGWMTAKPKSSGSAAHATHLHTGITRQHRPSSSLLPPAGEGAPEGGGWGRPAAPHDAIRTQLRSLLKLRPAARGSAPCSIDRALPGDEIAPGLRYHEQWLPWPAGPDVLLLHGIGQDAIARERLLAFDTETTGLAGGTGTRAFMIGAADWIDGGLRLRQLCITTLAAESAMLREFAGWLSATTALLSYNGKSYDRPLLGTRYRLARLPDPLEGLLHIDLLHPMRRRYRNVWPNCRLATAEHRLLGVLREDDLPGAEAPAAWLTWLRGGSAANLRRVAAHNATDLRSLCGLLERLADPS